MAEEEHQLLDVSDDEAHEIIGAAESIAMHNMSSATTDSWHEHVSLLFVGHLIDFLAFSLLHVRDNPT